MPVPVAVDSSGIGKAFCSIVTVSVANPALDGTGTLVDVKEAGTYGSVVSSVELKAIVATTPGMVRLFRSEGLNTFLIAEIPVAAVTPSGSVPSFSSVWTPSTPPVSYGTPGMLTLRPGETLKVSTQNGENIKVTVHGYDN